MNRFHLFLLSLFLSLPALGCGTHTDTTSVNTPFGHTEETSTSDAFNSHHSVTIDTDGKYDQCMQETRGNMAMCKAWASSGGNAAGYGYGPAMAPPGPSMYAGSIYGVGYGDPIANGYAQSARTVPPVVTRSEYDKDRKKDENVHRVIIDEEERNGRDIKNLSNGGPPTGK